jgi:dienelactone hydrolase
MISHSVEYKESNTLLEGHVAYDDTVQGKRPGVLLFSDWAGLGDYARKRASMLVELGYAVFCADVYGKGIRPNGMEACAAEMMKYLKDRPLLRARARAGLDQLRGLGVVDVDRLAAIGYCFGGLTSLELARSGADLRGVVCFHGNLNTPNPADAKNIKGKVLVLHGADDPVVPDAEALAFQQEMRDAKIDWQMVSYGNAVHAFTQWYIPPGGKEAAYEERADRRSWIAMQNFFKEIFV